MKVEEFIKDNSDNTLDNNIDYFIKSIRDKKDYLVIYFENKDKICISIENYFKYKINCKKGIDEKTFELLKNSEKVLLAYQSCIRKLSIKDYSIKQIKDHLNKYEINEQEINEIVNKLISLNLLDDNKYCINRINYLNKELNSHKQIKNKLIKEGINSNIIDNCLINDYNSERSKAHSLASKYSKIIHNKSINMTKKSIISKLMSAGYTYDISKDAISNIVINNNDKELINKEYNKCVNKYSKKYDGFILKQHIYQYLISKGFNSNDIKDVMEENV